ncbi:MULTISPECIES: cobalt-precorrin-4/precorrin-4 C(11)-methyltransferase [unclassified Actinopolyspora]|uniref:cobalt-precorrin-4/precorrin-4 C(11)-methyltransferase n=1 Tax=unclassified Actinopolyspora TaxID=2639451 RepID=UPI0013F65ADB|nr:MULTISPECIES: cobalt-precorrin-4/precorrin-4 C(11)-methyltransferase [unclassified Actinopolyspora]NHD17198.1 precorrin-4 C(11)-methyltransferase [Actinopolyspora sp. BKK2]NHE76350.1 precorrin-4 C(11)-methyltransferase [Actinopolyspora sp. BKK1]
MTQGTRTGVVSFIGAGPGAADLMTLRGARRIAEADIVLWTPSLISPECVREHVRGDAELIDTTGSSSQEVLEVCRRAERERLRVARVYTGDAVLWSAVQQQYDACSRMELAVEVVPGVSGHSAAAASVGRELTGSAEECSVWLGKPDGNWNSMPGTGEVREFAAHGATMALSVSASRAGQLVERLRAGGYEDDVPVVVAYKVTCPDELVLRTTLGEVADLVKRHRLWRHTLFLVGHALQPTSTRSRSYGSAGSRWGPGTGTGASASTTSRRDGDGRRFPRGEQGRTDSSAESRRRSGAGSGEDALLSRARGDEQRSGSRAEAEVAWWAVRDWQRNARDGIVRADVRGSHGRRTEPDTQAPDLFTTSQDPEVLEGFRTARAGPDAPAAAPGETSGDTPDRTSPAQVSPVDEAASGQQNAAEEVSAEAVAEQDVVEQDRAEVSAGTEPAATEVPTAESAAGSTDPSYADSTAVDSGGTGSEAAGFGTADSETTDSDGQAPPHRSSGKRNSGGSRAKQQSSTKQQSSKAGSRTGAARSSGKSAGTKTAGRTKNQRKTSTSDSEESSSRSGQSSQRPASGSSE